MRGARHRRRSQPRSFCCVRARSVYRSREALVPTVGAASRSAEGAGAAVASSTPSRPALPVVEVPEQVVEREGVARAVPVAPEDDVRPAAHAHRRVPVAAQSEPLPRDRANEHALVARARERAHREKVRPTCTVVPRCRTRGGRSSSSSSDGVASVHHRIDQPQRTRVAELARSTARSSESRERRCSRSESDVAARVVQSRSLTSATNGFSANDEKRATHPLRELCGSGVKVAHDGKLARRRAPSSSNDGQVITSRATPTMTVAAAIMSAASGVKSAVISMRLPRGRAPMPVDRRLAREQHHRHRDDVREQQRQLLDGAICAALVVAAARTTRCSAC